MSDNQFDREAFNREPLDLMERHNIHHSVLLFRQGTTLCTRVTADNPVDSAAADVLANIIEEAANKEEAKIRIMRAAREALQNQQQENN